MCRILLVKSKHKINPEELLVNFAMRAKENPSIEGDWQGDGFGVSYLVHGKWERIKSAQPIWEQLDLLKNLPEVNVFSAHARSASYDKYIGDDKVNQPYMDSKYSYVFNGNIQGVKMARPIPGRIGAEKIWYLLKDQLKTNTPIEALANTQNLLKENSRHIIASNIGLSDGHNIYASNVFTPNHIKPDYHVLKYLDSEELKIISSDSLVGLDMKHLQQNHFIQF